MLDFNRLKPSWVVGILLVCGVWGIWFLYKSDFITKARKVPLWLWTYAIATMIISSRIKDERKKLVFIFSISAAVLLMYYIFELLMRPSF